MDVCTWLERSKVLQSGLKIGTAVGVDLHASHETGAQRPWATFRQVWRAARREPLYYKGCAS
jgi:hypothetical protein